MDTQLFGMIISYVKQLPGTAVTEAQAAANDASDSATAAAASATLAAQHSMGVSVSGTTLVFTQLEGE